MGQAEDNECLKKLLPPEQYAKHLQQQKVKWVTNNYGELGVEVDGVVYFMYKGESLIYSKDVAENAGMTYRPVGKREFGESGPKLYNFDINDFDGVKPMPLF